MADKPILWTALWTQMQTLLQKMNPQNRHQVLEFFKTLSLQQNVDAEEAKRLVSDGLIKMAGVTKAEVDAAFNIPTADVNQLSKDIDKKFADTPMFAQIRTLVSKYLSPVITPLIQKIQELSPTTTRSQIVAMFTVFWLGLTVLIYFFMTSKKQTPATPAPGATPTESLTEAELLEGSVSSMAQSLIGFFTGLVAKAAKAKIAEITDGAFVYSMIVAGFVLVYVCLRRLATTPVEQSTTYTVHYGKSFLAANVALMMIGLAIMVFYGYTKYDADVQVTKGVEKSKTCEVLSDFKLNKFFAINQAWRNLLGAAGERDAFFWQKPEGIEKVKAAKETSGPAHAAMKQFLNQLDISHSKGTVVDRAAISGALGEHYAPVLRALRTAIAESTSPLKQKLVDKLPAALPTEAPMLVFVIKNSGDIRELVKDFCKTT